MTNLFNTIAITLFTDIVSFHEKFGLEQNAPMADLHPEEWALRHRRLFDEYAEFQTAVASNDKAEILDAFVDMTYIALGTIYRKGWPIAATLDLGLLGVLPLHSGFAFAFEAYSESANSDNNGEMFVDLVSISRLCVEIADDKGWDFQEAWNRVHAANMAKERGKPNNSKYGSGFDIVKPEGWTAPDLSDLVLPKVAVD